jgi:heavy metal sensor kinase
MNRWPFPFGVRARLTLWYVAAMVVVLTVYAAGVFGFVSRSVSRALDGRIRSDFTWAAEMWEQQSDGSLTWFAAEDVGQDEDNPWLQVWSPSGDLLFQTAVARRNPVPESAALAARTDGRIVAAGASGPTFRVLSRPALVGGTRVVIQVARSEAPMRRELRELTLFLALGLPFGVAAAGLGGYALARGALAPVNRMAARARSITAARLDDRLPVDNPHDELGRLALVFNQTLERLEASFQQMQQFTADVSHELRTPLTAIRTVGEVALREPRSPDAYLGIIGSMLEEVDRLTCLVDRLLTLSRATSGQTHLRIEAVDLRELADDVVAHLGVLAEENNQTIVVEHVGAARSDGDRLMLRQALINLLDNAIKYSPAGSQIHVRVSASQAGATLEVCDTGPGIAPERSARIFDRFYRAPSGADRGGMGLGLSISKWAVEANRGQLSWEGRAGGGSVFRITLPLVDSGCVPEPRRRSFPAVGPTLRSGVSPELKLGPTREAAPFA